MGLINKISSRYKTVLMFLISSVSIAVLLIVTFYTSIEKIIYDDYYNTLKLKTDILAQLHIDELEQESPPKKSIKELYGPDNPSLFNNREYIIHIKPGNTGHLADSLRLPHSFIRQILVSGESSHQDDSLQYIGMHFKNKAYDFIVITAAENYFKKHVQSHLQRILVISLLTAVAVAVLISYYLSKNLFKPINKITRKVKEINSVNLHYRLEEEKYNNELNQLINTFNEMLNRIETSFESQNNFISNASHELRTPLTSIIGAADVSLSKPRRPEEYVETLSIILHEAEKLDSKTKALLSLAQTGFNGKVQQFSTVRIDELLWDCISTIQRLYHNCKIQFDTSLLPENSSKLQVTGNQQLLHLAFTNIIINGCKYSNNQLVKVSVGATNTQVIIIVQDFGIGIPDQELRYIFDPFYRASNTKKFEGYGIGLPLTRNILKMHNGKITINTAENKGTTVEVHLPIKRF